MRQRRRTPAVAIVTGGLYAVLAVGPMSVLSPTVAALSALLPAVGIALGERLAPIGYAVLVVVAVVVFLAGMLRTVTPHRPPLQSGRPQTGRPPRRVTGPVTALA